MSQDPGWQPPSQPAPQGVGGSGGGWAPPAQPGGAPAWGQPGTASGQAPPGPTPGQAPPGPPPAWGPGPAQPGWGRPGWVAAPEAKPGVVALRPLGVGELLDGAVATLRQNPGPMLGLSAVVAVVTQLVQLSATWLFLRDTVTAAEDLPASAEVSDALAALSGGLWVTGVAAVLTWLATVVLTGILTVVVSRAVLGQRIRAREAWATARPRLPRLLGLTLLVALVIIGPALVVVALSLLAWAVGAPGAAVAAVAVLLGVASVPLTIWLYVRLALSTPALMLETTTDASGPGPGGSRPATVLGSLRRSAALVRGAWWRTFGILLLALVITAVVSQVVAVPAALPLVLDGPFVADDGAPTLLAFAIQGLAGVVGTTLTAPFTAALTVLLYVDRRIRREGLDIELARAAGVRIPGRTDLAPPPA